MDPLPNSNDQTAPLDKAEKKRRRRRRKSAEDGAAFLDRKVLERQVRIQLSQKLRPSVALELRKELREEVMTALKIELEPIVRDQLVNEMREEMKKRSQAQRLAPAANPAVKTIVTASAAAPPVSPVKVTRRRKKR